MEITDDDKLLKRIEELVDTKKEEWACKITKADNGFVIEYLGSEPSTEVITEEDTFDDKGELEAMQKLLWTIKEHFGIHYSKYNKFNLEIGIKEDEELE